MHMVYIFQHGQILPKTKTKKTRTKNNLSDILGIQADKNVSQKLKLKKMYIRY